jgi:hypothetical protein
MADNPVVWRVLGWNPVRMIWTVRGTHDDRDAAAGQADRLRGRGVRVRVSPAVRRRLAVKPPVSNETREWRLGQAGRMSDLADASKRYKSPG